MLEDLKRLLGIEDDAPDLAYIEKKLSVILKITTQRLKFLIGSTDIPEELQYIITEVSIIRFNKLGSEGLSSHTVEGESSSFSDNDFAGYMDDIKSYLDSRKELRKGKVRFL